MALAVHRPHLPDAVHLSRPEDDRHPVEAALAAAAIVVGLVAISTAPAHALHAVTAWLGATAALLGAGAQMVSATTRERWFCVSAIVLGAVSVLFGLAHGGWM